MNFHRQDDPTDPSLWVELKTQRPVVLGLLAWLLALAIGCVLLQPPAGATEDWVSLSVSNGQGAPASPLDVADCDATPADAAASCVLSESHAQPARTASTR